MDIFFAVISKFKTILLLFISILIIYCQDDKNSQNVTIDLELNSTQ